MGIKYGKLLYFHGVVEGDLYKKISILEYINRTVYNYFNNTFTSDFGILAFIITPITIDDRPCLHKRSQYTPDMLPYAFSVSSENYFITLTTLYDSLYLLHSDDPNTMHVLKKYATLKGRFNRGYCCSKHGLIRCYKYVNFYGELFICYFNR